VGTFNMLFGIKPVVHRPFILTTGKLITQLQTHRVRFKPGGAI